MLSARGESAPAPGWAAIALAVVCCGMAGGCGHQDRLEPMVPPSPSEPSIVHRGELEDLQPPVFESFLAACQAGWSVDEGLIGADGGVIVHRDGKSFRRVDLPATRNPVALVCLPDDEAWCLDEHGGVYELVGDEWVLERDLDEGTYLGMQADAQGRLWAYGRAGRLMRRDGAIWQRFVLPDTLNFDDAWIAPDGTGHFITDRLVHVTIDDVSYHFDTVDSEVSIYPDKLIEGTDDGCLVVAVTGDDRFWIRDGAEWQAGTTEEDEGGYFSDVFWLDGELWGLLRGGVFDYDHLEMQIARWDGQDWVDGQDVPARSYYSAGRSFPLPSGRVLYIEHGLTVFFDGGTPTIEMPDLGAIAGAAWWEDAAYVGYVSGEYMIADGDGWRLRDRVLPVGEDLDGGLAVDADGALVFFGIAEAWRLASGGEPDLIEGYAGADVFRQGDGSILARSAGEIREYSDGEFRTLRPLEDTSSPAWICRTGADVYWLLSRWRVSRLDDSGEKLMYLTTGWIPGRMLADPARGLVLFRDDKVLLRTEAGLEDRSPWIRRTGEWERLSIYTLYLDEAGDWLGFSPSIEAMLEYDGETWQQLDLAFPRVGRVGDLGLEMVPAGEGTYLVYNPQMVCLIRDDGGTP